MKRLLILSVILISSQMLPIASTSANTPSDRIIGLSLTEGDRLQTSLSYLSARGDLETTGAGIYCDGLEDPDCVSKVIGVTAFLLPCSDNSTLACIKEVYARDANGEKISANFVRAVSTNSEFDFAEDLTRKLVAGAGTGGIWNFPGLAHGGGGNTYAVQARLEGFLAGSTYSGAQSFQPTYSRIEFGIAAVRETSGDFKRNSLEIMAGSIDSRITGADTIGANGRPDYKCVMTEVGKCFERMSFPTGYRFGMTVFLPQRLSGWFHGRIYTPEIVITPRGDGFEYSVEATPVKVPYIREERRSSTWSQQLIDYVNGKFVCAPNCSDTGGGFMMPGNSGKFAFDLTSLFLPVIKDKSTGTGDYWSIRTLDFWNEGQNGNNIQSCSSNTGSVSGIVTTNSMVYSAGPPVYNAETSSLDYKVLSPHFNEKDEENLGSYDLLLDSKVARCIYKFSDAPVKAEIEVFGSDGASKVATTVIGEKNGWLFMSANGFTYSEPTVRIKLTQDPPPAPTPTPTPAVTATPSATPTPAVVQAVKKRVSITCIKGAKSKKVSGLKPKCPKGFKKA